MLHAGSVRVFHRIAVFSKLPPLERVCVCRLWAECRRPEVPAADVLPDVGLCNSRIRHARRQPGIRIIKRAGRRSTAVYRRNDLAAIEVAFAIGAQSGCGITACAGLGLGNLSAGMKTLIGKRARSLERDRREK